MIREPFSGTTLFIGLGRMGEPMARRHAQVHPTVLFDLDVVTTQRLATELATDALRDLRALPDDVDAVILMLPDSRVVESVLIGNDPDDGLLGVLRAGSLVLDMGSSVPASTRKLAALAADRDIGYVDAPVSGGVSKAVTGELSIMVGGDPAAVARAEPHLEPLGASITHVGPSGSGHAAKALNNLLSATNLAAAAEALCVAQSAGIQPDVMVQVLNSSTGRSQATEVKYPQHILTGTFASGFEMDLMIKDLLIATALTEESGVSAPITARAVEVVNAARERLGASGLDHTEIVRYYEALNHARLRSFGTPDTERSAR